MTFNPVERALSYLECVRRLDTTSMMEYYAPDAQVWLPGRGWMTPQKLGALLDGARGLLEDGIRFAHEGTLVDGNRAVVMTACDSPLKSGGSYVNHFCFIISFDDDGKIAQLREYTDSAPAVAAFHSG